MKYPSELICGKILKRYKRFLADIELENGEIITAHTPNTGSMKTCWEPGWPVLLSYHDSPKRKLKYTLEMTHNGSSWINVNTSLTNKIAQEAVEKNLIKELVGFEYLKPEVKVGNSRLDFVLFNGPTDNINKANEKCYVEVKNVTMLSEVNKAIFPDAVTERGQKHLKELMDIVEKGHKAAMLFVINREDVSSFSPATEIDPQYTQLLKNAHQAGVLILPYQSRLSENEVIIAKRLPFELS